MAKKEKLPYSNAKTDLLSPHTPGFIKNRRTQQAVPIGKVMRIYVGNVSLSQVVFMAFGRLIFRSRVVASRDEGGLASPYLQYLWESRASKQHQDIQFRPMHGLRVLRGRLQRAHVVGLGYETEWDTSSWKGDGREWLSPCPRPHENCH